MRGFAWVTTGLPLKRLRELLRGFEVLHKNIDFFLKNIDKNKSFRYQVSVDDWIVVNFGTI